MYVSKCLLLCSSNRDIPVRSCMFLSELGIEGDTGRKMNANSMKYLWKGVEILRGILMDTRKKDGKDKRWGEERERKTEKILIQREESEFSKGKKGEIKSEWAGEIEREREMGGKRGRALCSVLGDGCDPVVSHVPCGVWGPAAPLWLSLGLSGTPLHSVLLCSPLLFSPSHLESVNCHQSQGPWHYTSPQKCTGSVFREKGINSQRLILVSFGTFISLEGECVCVC